MPADRRSGKTRDPYDIPSLPRGATGKEVKRQYRRLALKYHPDKNGGRDERYRAIKDAYEEILAELDASRQNAQQGGSPGPHARADGHGGSGQGRQGQDWQDPWAAYVRPLFEMLVEYIEGQSWSDLRKAAALSLVLVGGVAATYALASSARGAQE